MAGTGNLKLTKVPNKADFIKAMEAKFPVEGFEVEGFPPVELRRLKSLEQEELFQFSNSDTRTSMAVYWPQVCARGVVNPELTAEEWAELPSEYVQPIAEHIGELTTGYQEKLRDKKAKESPKPFLDLSGSRAGSQTDTTAGDPSTSSST